MVDADGEKKQPRTMWTDDVFTWLRETVNPEPHELNIDKLVLRKFAGKTFTVTTGLMRETLALCKKVTKHPGVLACEYLRKKKIFGEKASIDEMASFKSKVKKQEPQYDPEVEKKKEMEKAIAEEEEAERKAKEAE